MDLATTYLGLRLPHPFVAGASPLSATVEGARRLEESGSAAVILPSLFEEGATSGEIAVRTFYADHDARIDLAMIPRATALGLSPRDYFDHLAKVKKAVRVPVIASLNGTGPGDWIKYASAMEDSGADALELNLYTIADQPWDPAQATEHRMLELVRSIKASVRIPVAVKLSPFYTSLPQFARELAQAGAGALVLFNRFYQADLDLERMEFVRTLRLSDSSELLLRLRWTAVLYGRVPAQLAVSGGVHTGSDAVKAILSGASIVQVVSALLDRGARTLEDLRRDTAAWFQRAEFDSLETARGRMSLQRAPSPRAFERLNYICNLDSWFDGPPLPLPRVRTVSERRS